MKIKTAQINQTLYVFDETTEPTIRRLIVPDGHAARFGNGRTEWIVDEPIVDITKHGSEQYEWDKSGNRVRHNRVRYVRDASGTVERIIERTVFKAMQ